jgi:allophanate hydrolase subunit 2
MTGLMNLAGRFGACGNVSIKIERQGLFDTIQDEGRKGFRAFGVPTGGWFDPYHAQLANALLNNDLNATCVEMTQTSSLFRVTKSIRIAIVGPGAVIDIRTTRNHVRVYRDSVSMNLEEGDSVQVRHEGQGLRSYLAVVGGWKGEKVLNSQSSEKRLEVGDCVISESHSHMPIRPVRQLAHSLIREVGGSGSVSLPFVPSHEFKRVCKLIGGLEEVLTGWRMSPRSNRVGLRFEGPNQAILKLKWPVDSGRLSEPVMPGTIQWTGQELIILGVSGGTMGGYPTLGQVASVGLPILAQLQPGQDVQIDPMTVDQARTAIQQDHEKVHQTLSRIRVGITVSGMHA